MDHLNELIAIEAIKRLKARYCRCADTKDWDGYAGVFTEDAVSDIGNFMIARDPQTGRWIEDDKFSLEQLEAVTQGVEWPLRGRAMIADFSRNGSDDIQMVHRVSSPEIDLTSDTTASGIWQMRDRIDFGKAAAPIRGYYGAGYYHETYVCIDNRWYIRTVKLTRTYMEYYS